ncbi:cyclopropane-fatty-acyl-phospholipid synthase family protein [Vibrio sp. SCSIO 43136]|uniref:SAM-dependent methyltransferase n=1 Tax=Vibrio sp. SCSIO 43136 TaxID=2819101 RepID=UPI0020756E1A|nr:cyclopropane-fatty-acyl-phospholipid synthase family protein [Vibrio sp. SCSIO 43136]USD64366.1 class I SAM-dependent methyltransferase [Vibrio sp. SCSIO 43136]
MYKSDSLVSSQTFSTSQKIARTLVHKALEQIAVGHLVLVETFGDTVCFGDEKQGLSAVIEIHDPDVYQRVIKAGDIGAAEAYMDKQWDSQDLTILMQVMAANLSALDALESNQSWLSKCVNQVKHWFNRNTLTGSKKNIEAHYDLGNDLYTTFLDTRMLYSSGIFHSECDSLEEAQLNKMERLCQELELDSSDHVLEIGTGWGAMAIYMATHYGCKVTTTTISEEQHAYTQALIKQNKLEDRIELLKQDYRTLTGRYDKIVSIEMIEAVGEKFLPSYISQCNSLLKKGGKLAIQSITIADQRYDHYANSVDFIQKYIFPGGFLPSVTQLCVQMTQGSQLVMRDLKDIGLDYADTLAHWHHRFNLAAHHLQSKGYDERFCRMWRYYLSYCEGGFRAKTISTVQLTFEKVA